MTLFVLIMRMRLMSTTQGILVRVPGLKLYLYLIYLNKYLIIIYNTCSHVKPFNICPFTTLEAIYE